MPRIHPVTAATANPSTTRLLDQVESKLGSIPNIIATMAQSEATANACLDVRAALDRASLPAQLPEQIALTVGQANDCQYCLSAHTLLAGKAGATETEILSLRNGTGVDAKTHAVPDFAGKLVDERDNVTDADLQPLAEPGLSPAVSTENVATAALNICTHSFNHVAETDIDFPLAPALATA
jgi:AhpD family alkylhydroperoxidase